MTASTFYGRVQTYVNENGKERHEDREFDDPRAYEKFLSSRRLTMPAVAFPEFGRSLWGDLDETFRLADRLADWSDWFPSARRATALPDAKHLPEGIKLDEYEKEREKVEKEEAEKARKEALKAREKQEKVLALREARERLENYAEEFEAAGRPELAAKALKDLAKVEAERAQLES